ncbi:hypothetical protein ACFRAQ_35095 [Nocardia sp. NPDC056611]|uniref:phage tail termination protein n=1 Tax=Nocardia sp. NPDC056611 TaxID=3345877 RepID=UPI00367084BB
MSFPDAELVCMGLLDDLGYTCTGLPSAEEWPNLLPIIAIRRTGGGIDINGITDRAMVSVVVIDSTRPKAWETAGAVRDRLRYAGATEVDGVLIDTTEEIVGNNQEWDIDVDDRFVDMQFWVTFRET